jgi:AraC-like DNA-binding protein
MIGEPPIQYLTHWRLRLAAQALRASSDGIARIAERSGYDSEAAFRRAFKREFRVLPTVGAKLAGAVRRLPPPAAPL